MSWGQPASGHLKKTPSTHQSISKQGEQYKASLWAMHTGFLMYEMKPDTRPTLSYLFNPIKLKAGQSHGGEHSPNHRAAVRHWMPNLGEKLLARPTFMSLEGCDHWTGILLQLQQGDLSRVIANEGMLSIQIIPEKQSRTGDSSHLSTFPQSKQQQPQTKAFYDNDHRPEITMWETRSKQQGCGRYHAERKTKAAIGKLASTQQLICRGQSDRNQP